MSTMDNKLEKKYNFVYITTNLINGKQYIGDHSTNDLNCNRTKNYLGSGRYYIKVLKKYGNHNFKREILEYFNTKEEAFNAQEKYIKQYNTLVPNGYNISPKGGLGCIGCFSNITILKWKESRKGKGNSFYGKKHSEKIKELNRQSHLGKIASFETKIKLSKIHKGKTKSEIHKQRLKESNTGKKHIFKTAICPHCGKEGKQFAIKRWHLNNCKLKNNN